ncbi:MAG: rRNA cytosine-C5-methyltransferase [Propionibacteriales bacterium]|nr:rRNA cytosine-C5-methyltransferase [Propionibacteriales bacterium]
MPGSSPASSSVRSPDVPTVDEPRRAAHDILTAVREQDAYVNLTLPRLLRERRLTGRDAAFTTELTHGTLRRQGTYDAVLDSLSAHPLDPRVRDVLRLGTHQLLAMRTSPHAAVGTSVDLVRDVVGARPTGLVNAILRKVAARGLDQWVDAVAPDRTADLPGHLAVRHSHPRWVVEAMADAVGADWGETEAVLAADNEAPQVTLVARPGRSEVSELVATGARAGRWSPYAATMSGGDPGSISAVRDGRAGVQDEGSQLVALALAAAPLDGPDVRWLDPCAGPGGKAALLGALATRRGAHLLAGERLPHRAALVRQAVGDTATVMVADGTRPPWAADAFDRVLVDAPCTGLGALRRRPEARWRRQPEDLPGLVALQQDLLGRALDSCRPGGVVAYVTCSPHLAETRGVIAAVTVARTDVVVEDARPLLPGVPDLSDGPYVQLWPHRHGTDAMFLALLRRR